MFLQLQDLSTRSGLCDKGQPWLQSDADPGSWELRLVSSFQAVVEGNAVNAFAL